MARGATRLLALLGVCSTASAVHQAAHRNRAHWSLFGGRANKTEKTEKKTEEEGEVRDTSYHGLPAYYEGHMPPIFFNMSHMEREDFYFRVERWHELMTAAAERCRSPRPGEKVVYFVQHGEPTPKSAQQEDAELMNLGMAQAKNFRYDPLLASAISNNPKRRVQVLLTSPARKAMQTAVLGFSDLLPEINWELDPDLRGFGFVEGSLVPKLGLDSLTTLGMNESLQLAAANLWSQYKDLPSGFEKGTKPHKDRWFDLKEHLIERPEERFLIVTHSQLIKMANVTKTHTSEVTLRALLPDRTWRKLSPPDCWPADL